MKIIQLRKNGTRRVFTNNKEISKTDQSFVKECDINEIIKKFNKTGQIAHLAKNQGAFADISEIPDLLEAMSTVTTAQQTFNFLPAELRKRFGNSPVEMVNFLQDTRNDEEAIKLGLKVRKKTSTSVPTREEPPVGKKATKKNRLPPSSNDDELNDDE